MGDLDEVRDPLTLFPSELPGPGEVALRPMPPVVATAPVPTFPETGVIRPAFVLTERQTRRLLTRRWFGRYVRRPLRRAASFLRKELTIARAAAAIHASAIWMRATSKRPALTWPRLIVVIRVPAVHRTAQVPMLLSASSTFMLVAMTTTLVVSIGPSMPSPALPPVARPTLATITPPPIVLEQLLGLVTPPAPSAPVLTPAALSRATSGSAMATIAHVVRPAPTPQFVGTLVVESEPAGATVFINQEPVGQTPLTLPDLRAGSRAVWVESAGYQRWTAGVLVPADKLTRINVKLEREPRH
ncbi:MAG TPA: PEGA domain-containing protein [Vicinamibacterales bacterium]|nr:PEGA domain-containing protein [Vicinamibacterales bacterium]